MICAVGRLVSWLIRWMSLRRSVPGVALAEVLGVQEPRFRWQPESVANSAADAAELCAQLGMPLDPWQVIALETMLGEQPDGRWSAFECALIVARQNGKGGVLEARELAGLFLFGERLIIHSAHEFSTAAEAFIRMKNLIDGTDWLRKRVKKVSNSHGAEGFELMSGQRLSYRTRTAGGGRGFSGDLVILDEAQNLNSRQLAALMPTLSARPNPQLVYTGTVAPDAAVLHRLVERGRRGGEDHLAYAEWSADEDADPADPRTWAQANPAMPVRIAVDYVEAEQQSMPELEFSMERLSIWPEVMALGSVIPVDLWASCEDLTGEMPEDVPVAFGVAVSPGRDWASVGVAGVRPDGTTYVEVVEHAQGTDWLLPYLVGLVERNSPQCVVVDQAGPAATLMAAMVAAKLPVRVTDTTAYKAACAGFADAVKAERIRHRGQQPLTDAAVGVREHRVGDSWVYARRDSGVVISPLEAVTLAVWGLTPDKPQKEFFMQDLNAL
jgi:hypothetical protein